MWRNMFVLSYWHGQVSMVGTDGLVHILHQGIRNRHDDVGRSVSIRSSLPWKAYLSYIVVDPPYGYMCGWIVVYYVIIANITRLSAIIPYVLPGRVILVHPTIGTYVDWQMKKR